MGFTDFVSDSGLTRKSLCLDDPSLPNAETDSIATIVLNSWLQTRSYIAG